MARKNEEDMDVIMVIGSTGLGKSTLIKSFCSDKAIKTSAGALSCTHDAEIYRERKVSNHNDDEKNNNSNQSRIWLDTIGAEDASGKLKDEDVLRNVMQMLEKHIESKKQKINLKIKVIWVVKPDVRATNTLQTQAQFISSFSQKNKDAVWNSTIIVVKEGHMSPGKNVQGALHAAFINGASSNGLADSNGSKLANIHNIGFTRLDLKEFDDEEDREYYTTGMPPKRRIKEGFLYEKEAKNEIISLLKKIKYFPININKQKCTKCGIIGDKRFVNVSCHPDSEFIHTQKAKRVHTKSEINVHQLDGIELYHAEGITNYHDGSEQEAKVGGAYHDGSPEYYHEQDVTTKKLGEPYHNKGTSKNTTGEKQHLGKFKDSQFTKKLHSGTIEKIHDSWYHEGNVDIQKYGHFCPKCGDDMMLKTVNRGSFECVLCKGDIIVNESMYRCGNTCNANVFDFTSTTTDYDGNEIVRREASGTFVCIACAKQESRIVYSCCNGLANSEGCEEKFKNAYSCCNRPEFSEGCKEEKLKGGYTCCGEDEKSQGCQDVTEEIYKCCGGTKTSEGCYTISEDRYQCCGGPSEHPGCKLRYTCCGGEAGSKGCKVGKTKIWSCCDSNIKATGCKLKYPCCDKSSSFDGCKERTICCKQEKGSLGCKQVYGCCEQPLNKKGCTFKFGCCDKTMETDDGGCFQQCMNCKKSWGNTDGCLQEDVEHDMIDY